MVSQKTRRARPTSRRTTPKSGPAPGTSAPRAKRSKNALADGAAVVGRYAAPRVHLGMTAAEVRKSAGNPECILFGSDEHVEWQFGSNGFDAMGSPTLYVTQLTFSAGRVVRITERMAEPR